MGYPNHYATHDQAKTSNEAYKFNCAQRAHSNLMENMPQTIVSMMFSGLEYPMATAALGLGWALTRSLYAVGYVGFGKRFAVGGGAFWLFQAGIWGLCCSSAWKML